MLKWFTWVALAAALLTPAAGLAQSTSTDTPQLAPPSPPRLASIFDVESPPAAYDMAVTILDFDPGAATGARMYAGRAFFTVVAGQLDVDEGQADVEPVSHAQGEKFSLDAGAVANIENTSTNPARLFMTTLSTPDAPAVQAVPGGPIPLLSPTLGYTGEAHIETHFPHFMLSQLIIDFGPGSGSGAHQHNGVGMSIVMAGEMTNRLADGDRIQDVGSIFLDEPNRPTDHRNFSADAATIAASYLNPVGLPAAVPAVLVGSPPLQAAPPPASNHNTQSGTDSNDH